MRSLGTGNVKSQSESNALQIDGLLVFNPNDRDGDGCDSMTGMFFAFQ
jgi:hypothetical protein